MKRIMDYKTADHFYNWLESRVADDEQHTVEEAILKLFQAYPGEYPGERSWPDIRRHAEIEFGANGEG